MISIGTTFNYDITLEKQLPMIKDAGFSHVSLGERVEHSGYLTSAGQQGVQRLLEKNDLEVCSIHSPFGRNIDISSPDCATAENTILVYEKCIDTAVLVEARVVIFHPTAYMRFEDLNNRKKRIVDNVRRLLEHIGGAPVSLAVENESSAPPNEILGYSLDAIADHKYGFCYDSSHDNLADRPLALLKHYGHRLLTTHISDNRGEQDDHMLPYEGTFPWRDFCRLFSRIDFEGILLLEVEMRESAFKKPEEFLKETFARGQRLLAACQKE
jgi:sugar phosphate isomerase/epimerase